MEELASTTITEERMEDCDVEYPELQDLTRSALQTGFSREEILIAVSELVAEDFATVTKTPARCRRRPNSLVR
jgi:hypothetical protein